MSTSGRSHRFRLPLILTAAVVAVVAIAAAVIFSSRFQTWLVRRMLAQPPGIGAEVGRVSAGWNQVALRDLRFVHEGAVLSVPVVEAEVSLFDAVFRDRVKISRLVAKGWTIDASRWQPAPKASGASTPSGKAFSGASTPPPTTVAVPVGNPAAHPAAAREPADFGGVFTRLQFPIELALDRVDLAGSMILPSSLGRATLAVSGGGLAESQTGQFDVAIDAALTDPKVSRVVVRGRLSVGMDTPGSLSRIEARVEASASGTQFPDGVRLTARTAAARRINAETYAAAITSDDRELLQLTATLPDGARQLQGVWRLDLRDADVTPFALGWPLPAFAVRGEGGFTTDAGFADVHSSGNLQGTAERLVLLSPRLAGVGHLQFNAGFDVARRGEIVRVDKLHVEFAGERPVAGIRALQSFELNPRTGAVSAADGSRELVGIALQGLPLAWIQPLLAGIELRGDDVRGEISAAMRAGGISLHTKVPLILSRASLAQGGKPLLEGVDLRFAGSADHTPQGWQAEVAEFTARSATAPLLSLSGRAGQLAGDAQPVKATGKLQANLPVLLEQPVAVGRANLNAGAAQIDFIASLGTTKEFQVRAAFTDLVAIMETPKSEPAKAAPAKPEAPGPGVGQRQPVALPKVSLDLRADLAPSGQWTVHAPVAIEQGTRKSDLTIAGTLVGRAGSRSLEAQVASSHFVLDDAKLLAGLLPPESPPETSPTPDAPLWAGWRGKVDLNLLRLVYSETLQAADVTGTLRLEEGTVRVEGMRMGLGEGAAQLEGRLGFDRRQEQPYGISVSLELRDFDPGPLFKALQPDQPPTVEGRFNLRSDLTGRARSFEALAIGTQGEFELTSRGGIFRGLPLHASNIVENTGRLAGWLASAGAALGNWTGRRDQAEITSKAEAVAELARGMYPITYDQLAVQVVRDAQRNTTIRSFTLISPELRLSGSGRVQPGAGPSLLDDSLAMDFTLRARGRQGELLRFLGALEPQTDDLGYAACAVPIRIHGTLGKPDATEFSNRVVALTVERSGLAEKATEFLNRIRGGGK